MKTTALLFILISLLGRGCQGSDDEDFVITETGDTIPARQFIADWQQFSHDSDSILCNAEQKMSDAVNDLDVNEGYKPGVYMRVRRAERLLERLTQKNESRKSIDSSTISLADCRRMLEYRDEYQVLETKVGMALENLAHNPK